MRASILATGLILVVVYCGCSGPSKPGSDLEARLSLSIVERDSPWPLTVYFVLDATGTIARLCPVDSLEVRWDLDGDGAWDSDFEAMHIREGGILPSLPFGVWSARCAVRDNSGNVSVAEESISLPEWMPAEPDLVVGDLIVNDHSVWSLVDMDTISVGSEIRILLPARIWGNLHPYTTTQIKCIIDGELVSEKDCVVAGPYAPDSDIICPFDSLSVLDPGVHIIEVVLESPAGVVDSNETNNRVIETRVFVDATN